MLELVSPDSVGMDAAQLARIGEHLRRNYIDPGRIPGSITLVARGGRPCYLDVQGRRDVAVRAHGPSRGITHQCLDDSRLGDLAGRVEHEMHAEAPALGDRRGPDRDDFLHATRRHRIDGGRRGIAFVGADLGIVGDGQAVLNSLDLEPGSYALATVHRSENTDDRGRLSQILLGLSDVARGGLEVVFPVHPRTRSRLDPGLVAAGVRMIEPLGHPEAMAVARDAALVLTDSGGLQKETYWLETPCVTMRDETEWVETVSAGWNVLAGADRKRIVEAARRMTDGGLPPLVPLYGEGTRVSAAILDALVSALEQMAEAS